MSRSSVNGGGMPDFVNCYQIVQSAYSMGITSIKILIEFDNSAYESAHGCL
jgi:hypothetical protein